VTILGEVDGGPGTYTFTATYEPANASPAITFEWDNGDEDATSIRTLTVGTHTLAVTLTNCLTTATAALVTDSHTIVLTAPQVCTDVSGLILSVLTPAPVYPGTPVSFRADILPDEASPPYEYQLTVDGLAGDELVFDAEPLVLTETFTTVGLHTVEIAVWNCAMTAAEAVTASVAVDVQKEEYYI
jgi:hypothetical protein